MLRLRVLEKKTKLFFKNGCYLDYKFRQASHFLLKWYGVLVSQFFGEKYVLEGLFRFNLLSYFFNTNVTTTFNNTHYFSLIFKLFSLFFLLFLL